MHRCIRRGGQLARWLLCICVGATACPPQSESRSTASGGLLPAQTTASFQRKLGARRFFVSSRRSSRREAFMHSKFVFIASGLLLSTPAFAAETTIVPVVDLRLRQEGVEQAGLARDAEAITLRGRVGAEISNGAFAFLAEAEGTAAIGERYNSGLNGKTAYPLVADPQNVELNRVQVQYEGFSNTVLTVGRQRINLYHQRLVGAVGWRD